MSDYMADLASVYGVQNTASVTASHSTSKKAGNDLDMDGFLQLMVASFQNQSIDDTADTSEMLNQMVQMSVIQAISSLSTLISDSANLSYAASLVGKEVTIGERYGNDIKEILGTVTGTGTLNGKQVVFLDDEETPYYLTDIMAVGRLPETKSEIKAEADTEQKRTEPVSAADEAEERTVTDEELLANIEDEIETVTTEQAEQLAQAAQAAEAEG